jgi:hypothetical protein
MRCNQCDSLYINGVFCHERGCPNTRKVYNQEYRCWETPEPEYEDDDVLYDFYDEQEDNK